MGKGKIARFREVDELSNVIQPEIKNYVDLSDHPLKGNWAKTFFKNDNPLVLELACGKGEYNVNLARKNPNRNYLGIDIKGARIWRGAKTAHEEGLKNVGFLRTRIELLRAFFDKHEISEIWITFPDPQPKKPNKRLTSPRMLTIYQHFLIPDGMIHLKTDNEQLFHYTLAVANQNNLVMKDVVDNIYETEGFDFLKSVKTFYEKQFITEGRTIKYMNFYLNSETRLLPPEFEER